MHDPKKAIAYDGSLLPAIDWNDDRDEDDDDIIDKDEDGDYIIDSDEEGDGKDVEKADTSIKQKIFDLDLDLGMNDEYMNLLEDKGLKNHLNCSIIWKTLTAL